MQRIKLVILGTGFGGFSLLKKIDTSLYDVQVISPRDHFLFTPLLPSTTVGTLEFRSIIESIYRLHGGIQYIQASCESIDPHQQSLQCRHASGGEVFLLQYDRLVIAVGAINNDHGIPGIAEHAYFLKELGDARAVRQRIIECFEQANLPGISEREQQHLLHFVVVGGGPTGIEFAAEMHDFLVEDIAKVFPNLMTKVHISVLEAAENILGTFDDVLSAYTMKHFHRQQIDVRTNAIVTRVQESQVELKSGEVIPFGLLVWSTGIGPGALVQSLSWQKEKRGQLLVDDFLRIKDLKNIYALGDCASIEGKPIPATAQVAQQQGFYLAKAMNLTARGRQVTPFRYKNLGMLAYIGGNKALADLASVKWKGFTTWLFWRSAYLTRLVSLKNKILVVFDWCKTMVFGRDVSRF